MIRYKTLTLIFLLSLLSLLSACSGGSSGKNHLQNSLNQYYALWKSKQVDTYSIKYQRDCVCEPSYHYSLIENGDVLSSWDILTHKFENEDELYRYTTIEYLFETIQFALDYGADYIYVDFDEQYGYPRSVEIDYNNSFSGDFVTYEIEEFQEGAYVDVQYNLDIAQQNWEGDFLSDYTFTLEVNCFCDLNGEVLNVTVEDGAVTSATDAMDNDVGAQDLLLVPTIVEIFAAAQTAIDDEVAGVLAEFDPLWGNPISLSVNTTPQFVDDEFTYILSNVTVDYSVANQNKLDYYSALWQTEKPDAYHYLYWSPELDEAYQYHIEIVDDVASGHYLDFYGDWQDFDPLTLDNVLVEDYFALIEDALAQNADIIIVYYNKQLGYPTEIYIDYDETVEGDEVDNYVYINRYQ